MDLSGGVPNFVTGRNDGVVQRLMVPFSVIVGKI
jgi:hypothetical protein